MMWIIFDADGEPVCVTDCDSTKEGLLYEHPQYYAMEAKFVS